LEVVLVHPHALLLALVGIVPLAAFAVVQRRGRRVRRSLGLQPPPRRSPALVAAAISAIALLLGLASAGPVLLRSDPVRTRTDAEAYIVLDITRSMLASGGKGEPTRLERARSIATRLRRAVPDVPVGIASFTNRIVPHVFPTIDPAVFAAGLERSIEIESPPPDTGDGALLTALDSLGPLQTHRFFAPSAQRQVAVVLTDGETLPLSQATEDALRSAARLELLFVRIWSEQERIHEPRIALDTRYRSDPGSTAVYEDIVRAVGGRAFAEGEVGAAASTLRRRLGRGEAVVTGHEASGRQLAGWAVALAALPLAYVLRRRNV
jgi:hypothetical protein